MCFWSAFEKLTKDAACRTFKNALRPQSTGVKSSIGFKCFKTDQSERALRQLTQVSPLEDLEADLTKESRIFFQ